MRGLYRKYEKMEVFFTITIISHIKLAKYKNTNILLGSIDPVYL